MKEYQGFKVNEGFLFFHKMKIREQYERSKVSPLILATQTQLCKLLQV